MIYDVIIIGAGPAGMTASIYCARAGLSTMIIEQYSYGGKIVESPDVRNIPGFTKISGKDFSENLYNQTVDCGVEYVFDSVESVEKINNTFSVNCSYSNFVSRAVIVATGTKNRVLSLENEDNYIGNGISFCVTCDGPFYKGKDVIVVGGGNSAVTEAIELSKICRNVILLQNLSTLTAESTLIDKLNSCKNVDVICDVSINGYIEDNGVLRGISYTKHGNPCMCFSDGIFLAVGVEPQNAFIKNLVETDDYGYIICDNNCKTSVDGLYACGDCVANTVKQVSVACGNGTISAINVINYLK